MKKWNKVVKVADHIVNIIIVLCLLPILLYGIYAIWDAEHIYQQADASIYQTYKPTKDDKLSFDELKEINSEVFGWITVDGTNIDYPLMQSTNNSKYVNTDVNGDFSLSGSIFLDFRNKKDFSDMNNIIYGHHMQKNAMFGELELFDKKEYFENHKYGKIYFDNKWHSIEFFAFLHVDAYDSMIYNTSLEWGKDYSNYLSYIKENARYYRETPMNFKEHFVTLSTCTSSSTNGRHIIVGKILE